VIVSKDEQQLHAFAKEVGTKVKVTSVVCDLAYKEQVHALEKTIADIGNLEILVNCAGYGINKDFIDDDIQKREDMITVHDLATMRLTYQALKIMKKRNHGSIINVSSLAAMLILGNNPIYAASKMFLHSFSQNLYRIYKSNNIYIQSLCPGFTATNFAKNG